MFTICALYGDWEDCILYTYMLGSHMISPSGRLFSSQPM